MTWLLVAVGAALGAPARYLTDRAVQRRFRSRVPWGTAVVNIVGSGLLGASTEAARVAGLGGSWTALLGTGFCGALTTYSTLSAEVLGLLEEGRDRAAVLTAAVNVTLGVLAAAAGWGLVALTG